MEMMKHKLFFEYLEDNTKMFLGSSFPNNFNLDLKKIFKDIASEEKEDIDYNLLSRQILIPSGINIIFLKEYGDLYNFWFSLLLGIIKLDDFKSQQVNFLKDLMNRFEVYKKFKKPKKYNARDLYLLLLRNQNYTVNEIFLKTLTNKHNETICLQAKILFNLGKNFLKNCLVKEL